MPRTYVPVVVLALAVSCRVGWNPGEPAPSYPLIGEHANVACVSCHGSDAPPGPLPTTCASCHEDDRPPAPHPDGECEVCHTPFGWDQITVDHDFFPLTNAHAVDCAECHADNYTDAEPACASCHEDDRPADHFSGDCAPCHVPTTWEDASLDHDPFFPLPHHGAGEDNCEACHVNPDDYGVFSCVSGGCHPQSETNGDHDEVGGYTYDSDACLDCHPRGGGGD